MQQCICRGRPIIVLCRYARSKTPHKTATNVPCYSQSILSRMADEPKPYTS